MKVKELYWKYRRIYRKYRETVSRIISYMLIALFVAVVAFAAYSVYKSDVRRAELANQDKDKNTIKATNKNYGESVFQEVAENDKLVLKANFATGEICIEEKGETKENPKMVWYSNPQNRNEDKVGLLPELSSQISFTAIDVEHGTELLKFNNYKDSIRKGGMTHEKIENGVKFTFAFPIANVYIPVQYTLTDNGFQAEIVTSEIKGVGSNPYLVDSISLLPYFGAGGLEDEGYLFVPDGSGALINFNNKSYKHTDSYFAQVYGDNPTIVKTTQGTVVQNATLPVFGSKVNDRAFFGIVISGEQCTGIAAAPSMSDSTYNHVYPRMMLHEYVLKRKDGNFWAKGVSHALDYSKDLTEGNNYAVRYYFLEGEDANYTGMSKVYKNFLEEKKQLKDSELADKKYVVLDLVGAVSIEKYVMGIKRPVVTALTTYKDVIKIVENLKNQGVENLIINYVGAMNGGLNNKMFSAVSTESVLGSKKEFKEMIEYLQSENVLLFFETNPVDLYNDGNGYSGNRDGVKTFFDSYAFQYLYQLDVNTNIGGSRWHLLRPRLAAEVADKFTDSAKKWNVEQVSIDRIGEYLYTDYSYGKNHASRLTVLDLWRNTLNSIDEKTKYLMLHGGNAYCVAYADVITDVSDSSSDFDVENGSVPFYQMTFQDDVLLTANGINTTVDDHYSFLKALEQGTNLKFNLIYGDVSKLVGTDYNTMVSYSYDRWEATIVAQYAEMQKASAQFAGKEIVRHQQLTGDVALTVYESGELIINYGSEPYSYCGNEVAPRSYLILTGGAK